MCDTIHEPRGERCGRTSQGDVRAHGIGKSFNKEAGWRCVLKNGGLGSRRKKEKLQGKSNGKGIGIAQEGDGPTIRTVSEVG